MSLFGERLVVSKNNSNGDVDSEIAWLEEYCDGLSEAIGDLAHEARRVRDKLERVGGQSHQLTRELKRLEENRRFNLKELEKARRRLAELRKQSPG